MNLPVGGESPPLCNTTWTQVVRNRGSRIPTSLWESGGKQAFATREEAEASLPEAAEITVSVGMRVPDFQIIEAESVSAAMEQVTGHPFPPNPPQLHRNANRREPKPPHRGSRTARYGQLVVRRCGLGVANGCPSGA
jgi:hypothetical protein